MKKTSTFITLFLLFNFYSQAQSLAINSDGSAADVSALLDVKSTSKGLLIPRMTLAQKNTVSLPATGLLVYQTDGTMGLYVNNGTPAVPNWQLITASSNAWGLTGNTGTVDGTNFIGTTDNIPFTIKVNNQKAGRIDHLLGNSFFGYQSGNNTSTGAGNTTNGFNSFYNNVAGSNATAIGYQSMLYANNTSTAFTNYNVALGFEALRGSTTPSANTGNYNIALGYQSLWSNTTGNNNNATGYAALYSNTTGNDNVANGDSALYGNTTGFSNIAIGFQALKSNTTSSANVAIGRHSLFSNTIGDGNTAVGINSLLNNVSGSNNTAIGRTSLLNNVIGYENTSMGISSLWSNTSGYDNTAYGAWSLMTNVVGVKNVAIGAYAMNASNLGSYNTALGTEVLYWNTGNFNVSIGDSSLYTNTVGSNGTAIGSKAMYNFYGSSTAFTNYNLALGYEALRSSPIPTNNTGNYNTAMGYQTLWSNSSGGYNTAIGPLALYSNSTGLNNIAIGSLSLTTNTVGGGNIAVGINAMQLNTTGSYNTVVGGTALSHNVSGSYNCAIGVLSLNSNGIGSDNVAIGYMSSWQNSIGTLNTALGNASLLGNTTGTGNTAIGRLGLQANGTGSYNTSLGCQANVNAANLTNATAIGYNAIVNSSNTMQWGNSAITDIYAGVGTAATLHSGYAIIERTLNVDYQDQNGSAIAYGIKFGGAGTGEGIASNRTTSVNQWGLDFYTAFANRMCISNGGNVGIGTIQPASALDVNGQITIDQKNFGGYAGLLVKGNSSVSNYPNIGFSTQNTSGNDIISAVIGGSITNNNAGAEAIDLGFYTSTSGQSGLAQRMVIKDNGNVGIGETAPNAKLHISGSETTTHGMNSGIQLTNTASTNSWFIRTGATGTATPAGGFSIGDNSSYRFVINSSGNVGVATTAPTAMLSVNGNANNTTGSWALFSDERIKTITDDFTDGLTVIKKIQPVKFRYNDNAPFKSDEEQIGIVAQDLEKIAPYMVSQKPYKEFNDLREVNNQAYVFLLINAVKEQQVQIEAQQKENNGQKQRIDDLEKIVKELSRKVNQ